MRTFANRAEAGGKLADAVSVLGLTDPVVLALPRGGVPVAAPVARRLGAPLDVVLVRKIGLPGQEEVAAGAVVDGSPPVTVWNEPVLRASGRRPEDLEPVRERELERIAERRRAWFSARAPRPLEGRQVVVVDDGIATGSTMLAAIRAVRSRNPERIVLAVPVAPREARERFAELVDDVVILEAPLDFRAVGMHYRDFDQVSDGEVAALLEAVNMKGKET